MRISARNMLKGKVKSIVHGAVNTEVVVELPGWLVAVFAWLSEFQSMLALELSRLPAVL